MTILQQKLVDQVKSVTGLDPMRNTRRREYVEARALLIFLLKNVAKMYLSEITRFFVANGKSMHHATVMHSLKNFDIYMQYGNKFRDHYEFLVMQNKIMQLPSKKAFIKNKIEYVPEEIVEQVYELILES